MTIMKMYSSLCPPARLYIVLAVMGFIISIFQNFSQPNQYRLGNRIIHLGHHNALEVIFNICFVIVWTWLLNTFCKLGWSPFSWVLVLTPFVSIVLFFYMATLTQGL